VRKLVEEKQRAFVGVDAEQDGLVTLSLAGSEQIKRRLGDERAVDGWGEAGLSRGSGDVDGPLGVRQVRGVLVPETRD